ncbi:MAG: inositol monophosphatase family protein [Armatimonadota bacterium]
MVDTSVVIEHVKHAGLLALKLQSELEIELKSDESVVTNADKAIESYLRNQLLPLIPASGFYGEEQEVTNRQAEYLWACDPIDGTTNYSLGMPLWGVSVALLHNLEPVLGVIFLPKIDEMYVAEAGRGVTLNGVSIHVNDSDGMAKEDTICFSGDCTRGEFLDVLPGKPRNVGSCVVKMCWVAAGRFRAAFAQGRLYDIAAGWLICKEAGATIKTRDGKDWHPRVLADGRPIDVLNPVIVAGAQTSEFLFGILNQHH